MRKKLAAFLLAAALLVSCAGCIRAQSLDLFGYVLAVGFDKGETMPYKITLMLQKVDIESEAQKTGGFTLVSAECRSLFEAIETITGNLPYELNFARTMLLVFDRTIAAEPGALEELLNLSFSKLYIRYNASVFISLEKAHDVLQGLENDFDPNLTRMQRNFVTYSEETGLIPVANLTLLREGIEQKTQDVAVPLCGMTGDAPLLRETDSVGTRDYAYFGGRLLIESDMKTGLAGAALFRDGTMIGILDGQNTQLLLLATGEFDKGRIRLADKEGREMSVGLTARERPARSLSMGETPRAQVTIYVTADVEMPESQIAGDTGELTEWVRQYLEAQYPPLFDACRSLGTDVFGFGKLAVLKFTDTKQWESFDWKAVYANLEAEFRVEVELTHNPGKSILE